MKNRHELQQALSHRSRAAMDRGRETAREWRHELEHWQPLQRDWMPIVAVAAAALLVGVLRYVGPDLVRYEKIRRM